MIERQWLVVSPVLFSSDGWEKEMGRIAEPTQHSALSSQYSALRRFSCAS